MKVQIYSEKSEDKIVRLRLIEDDEKVALVEVSADGHRVDGGFILKITERGIRRVGSYQGSLSHDARGCVRLDE